VSRGRKAAIAGAVVAVLVVVVLILLYVPLEPTSSQTTADTSRHCGATVTCPASPFEFTVGDGRYATLTGTWISNGTGDDVLVTINNGASSTPCALCSGQLYSSNGSGLPTGSFDVNGYGPFHISVEPLANGDQATMFQITLDSAVI
jgi:hypothetical protein